MRLAIPLAILVASTAVAAAAAVPLRSGGHAQVRLRSTPLGSVLVDVRGRTLYLFTADAAAKSACAGQCAAAWPPFTTVGAPLAGRGLKAALLKTTTRKDGRLQVVYAGHPLYFYGGDHRAGATSGEGVEGTWFAVDARGAKVVAGGGQPQPVPPPTTTSPGTDPGYGDGY
jgi:predicted lipoprotein with Yx(FWY)xxD motif